MAGTARSGLFHFRHCVMFWLSYVKYGIMAYPAIAVILYQMDIMAEYHGISIFEPEQDVLGFLCE
jgi:hypothetical protein